MGQRVPSLSGANHLRHQDVSVRRSGASWVELIASVLADPSRHTFHCQPIVSIEDAAIVGYEALSRFLTPDGSPSPPAQEWFAMAAQLGVGARFEAHALKLALQWREELPENCFLTVNVNPNLLLDPGVADTLLATGDLSRLVIELTEQAPVQHVGALLDIRNRITELNGLVALDDVGAGYSGLQLVAALRPHLIKLDRTLVSGADRDDVRLALAEMVGDFAGRIDAWMLAEGVETWAEVAAFARMGVPLFQGYVLARPGPDWPTLSAETRTQLRQIGPQGRNGTLHALMEPLTIPGCSPQLRPIGSLRVHVDDDLDDVAARLLLRPEQERFDPLVVINEIGATVGILRVERIMGELLADRRASSRKGDIRDEAIPMW